jgi:phosphoglycerate dehydrogenase-like enzyme
MRLIVAEADADAVQARIKDIDRDIELLIVDEDGNASVDLRQAEILFRNEMSGSGYQRVLEQALELRWIHTASAGVETLLNETIKQRKIVLTNSAGVHAIPIAEWVLHAMLMIVKHARHMLAAQDAHRWDRSMPLDELTEKTLTVLGTGGIGQAIIQRAAGFDMRIWGINRSGRPVDGVERLATYDEWHKLLPETDFLVVTVPLTDQTRQMIGKRELEMLGPNGWIINIARGAIIDEPALVAALQDGTIGGAALDTFEQEPLPPDNPLWGLPNLIISPHHSGSSPRTMDRVLGLFAENLRRYIDKQELINVVDQEAGY